MKIGRWAGLLAAATLLAGCGNFWQAPDGSTSFSLSNSGNITVSPGSTNTATITVTPSSSFTGTVTLTCAVTAPTGATSPATCGLSSTSLTFSSATAQSSTLTATTSSSTTTGAYQFAVTGVSGSVTETTTVCVEVGTGTCSSPASTSGYFYVLTSGTLAGYSISSGSLNLISNSSFTLSGALAMAIDPNNHLWVATTSGITPYAINSSTGALTQGSAVFGDTAAGALQVDPSGKWLIDASTSGTLYAYPITTSGTEDNNRSVQTNRALASGAVATGGIAISPSGSTYPIIAVALGTTGTQVFPFTSSSTATPIGSAYSPTIAPYGTSGVAASVAVAIDPSNRFLYIGETDGFSSSTNSGALRVYSISSNSVSPISSSPYASGGTNPHAILASSNGYVYVANYQGTSDGNITAFLLNASTPASSSTLTLQSNTVSTGVYPYSMAVDSTGDFVLVVNNQGSPYFNAYTFDSNTTGKLDASVTGSTASNPIAIVAVP